MGLSEKEINQLIEKLRDRYREYADTYSPVWFNIEGYEERLVMAVSNRMNLEGFILAEIANFEKIKEKYDKKKSQKSFSEEVDRIIDEHLAQIKKYPALQFHPRAGIEISHFYGALAEFAQYYYPVLFMVSDERGTKDMVIKIEDRLDFLAMPRGEIPPKRVEDHIMILKRMDIQEIEIERDKNDYLKESAFVLHDIVNFCEGLIERKNPEWEPPLRMDKLFLEEKRKKKIVDIFTGLTGYGAIFKVRDQADGILNDFRLKAFKKS